MTRPADNQHGPDSPADGQPDRLPGAPADTGIRYRPATPADQLNADAQARVAAKVAAVHAARARAAAHATTAVIGTSEAPATSHDPAGHATYLVTWSGEDSEYVATSPAYPSLSWLDPDPAAALTGLLELLATIDDDACTTDRRDVTIRPPDCPEHGIEPARARDPERDQERRAQRNSPEMAALRHRSQGLCDANHTEQPAPETT